MDNNITVKVLAACNHVGIRYIEAYDLLIRSEVYEEEAELIDVYVSQLKAGLYYPDSKTVAEVAMNQVRRDKHYQHQVHDIALWIELLEAGYWYDHE
tara:strand:+ start:1045 stop:1335 length:291 start_codon:yes stop_codon:yes gene_type:complete